MLFSRLSLVLLVVVSVMFVCSLLIINAQMMEDPKIEISSPDPDQEVGAGILTIYGTSSDNALRPCHVSVVLNELWPYRNVTATGPEGSSDYSKWKFTFDPYYTMLEEGRNEIAAKIVCTQNDDTNSTAINKLYVTAQKA